jgi:hypothetical protein
MFQYIPFEFFQKHSGDVRGIGHLAGFCIGAVISNKSHSNKTGSTTVKRARLKVKDQGRRQCYHNKHKIFPIGLHVMYLYFPDTPIIILKFGN